MLYVQRDDQGRLLRVEDEPFDDMNDTLSTPGEDIAEDGLRARGEALSRLRHLRASDIDMLRIMEDLVYLLVERGVIDFADLPQFARDKLDLRALARAELEGFSDQLQMFQRHEG